jgi:hypothetical protein
MLCARPHSRLQQTFNRMSVEHSLADSDIAKNKATLAEPEEWPHF